MMMRGAAGIGRISQVDRIMGGTISSVPRIDRPAATRSGLAAGETPERPFVLVSIVAMNCDAFVAECVRALLAGTYPDFAILIVENGGAAAFAALESRLLEAGHLSGPPKTVRSDGCAYRAYASSRPGVGIMLADPGANLGYAGGNNIALRQPIHPDWDALWVLNPDTIPEAGALQALVDRQIAGGFGMVGSRIVFTASGRIQTWGGQTWNRWLGRGGYIGYMRPSEERPSIAGVEREIDFVCGAAMYVTRRYVETVGGMDERFFMFCEDVEWCLRGAALGFGYAHDSVVHHVHGATAGSSNVKRERSPFTVYMNERNKVLLTKDYCGLWSPFVIAVCLLGTLEHLLIARSPFNFRTALRGWWAGVGGETGMPKVIPKRVQAIS